MGRRRVDTGHYTVCVARKGRPHDKQLPHWDRHVDTSVASAPTGNSKRHLADKSLMAHNHVIHLRSVKIATQNKQPTAMLCCLQYLCRSSKFWYQTSLQTPFQIHFALNDFTFTVSLFPDIKYVIDQIGPIFVIYASDLLHRSWNWNPTQQEIIDQPPKSRNAPVPYPKIHYSKQKCANVCSE